MRGPIIFSRLRRLASAAAVVAVMASARGSGDGASGGVPPDRQSDLVGFANPSAKSSLAVAQPGRILEIYVREGDFVRAGQPVLRLDDAVQRARVEIAQAQADSTLEIELARVKMELAIVEADHVAALGRDGLVAAKELRAAAANAEAACLEWSLAQFRRDDASRALTMQLTVLDELIVRAPFDGYVSERLREIGESVEARDPTMTIARLDPLEVTVDCPLAAALHVRPEQSVRVVPNVAGLSERVGHVISINRVANAASQTVRLRISVSNSDYAWPAGLRVRLAFHEPPSAEEVSLVSQERP